MDRLYISIMQTNKNNISVVDAANKLRQFLPCEFDKDTSFKDGLNRLFNEYLEIIRSIDKEQFNVFIGNCKLNIENLTHRQFCDFAELIVCTIEGIIDTYLNGNPYKAYDQLQNLFSHNKVLKKDSSSEYKDLSEYLDGVYANLFSHDTTQWSNLFRIRIGEDIHRDNMYHVPFTERERVGTYRFSIPGWPAFYVGTSVDVCWNEVTRELSENEHVYVAKFKPKIHRILFNLQIPPVFTSIDNLASCTYVYYFLSTFPIFAASLVKVRYPHLPFKPEYILPQMILQYVKSNSPDNFSGILYSSTKCNPSPENPNLNIVLPTTETSTDKKICKLIKSGFEMVDFKKIDMSQDESYLQQLRIFEKNQK